MRGRVESCPTLVRDKVCYVLIWSWTTPHILSHIGDGQCLLCAYMVLGYSPYCQLVLWWNLNFIMVSEQVVLLLSTCRLENLPHMRARVESCPTLVRDKVCYVLIWSWVTPHIAN
ncbi:unnamed protein product [Malus baccata var. baccata]